MDRTNLRRQNEANETKRRRDNFPDGKATDIAVDLDHTVPQQHAASFTLPFGEAPEKSKSSSARVLVSLAAVPAGDFVPSPFSGLLANGVSWCPCRGWGKEGSERDGRGQKSQSWEFPGQDGAGAGP